MAVPAAVPQDAADPEAAQQELSAVRRELQGLQEGLQRQRQEKQQTITTLLAMRVRHRDCTVSSEAEIDELDSHPSSFIILLCDFPVDVAG